MKKTLFVPVFALLLAADAMAQCSMCSAVAETAQANGSDFADGVNSGILYLMGIPYALMLGVGVLLYRKLTRDKTVNN